MVKRKYQQLLESIVNSIEKQQGKFKETAHLAVQLLAEHLAVDNVGVCVFSIDNNHIEPLAYTGKANHILRFAPQFCPRYLNELKQHRIIDALDVATDSRVSIFYDDYFSLKHVSSTLDIAIRINGHLEGVLFLESEQPRVWLESEMNFAAQVADQLALTLATQRAYETDERLALFHNAIEYSEQVLMVVNLTSDVIEYANGAYQSVSGVAVKSILGHPITKLNFFKKEPEQALAILDRVKAGLMAKGDILMAREDGSQYWLRYSAKPFTTSRGNDYALVMAVDCSEERQHQQELEQLAWHCTLTGLYNRRFFNQKLERRTRGHLILIDMMGFKRFNDTYGHEKGDKLLIEVARRLNHFASINHIEFIARVGSDEFALMIDTSAVEVLIEPLVKRLYSQLMQPVKIARETFDIKPAISVVGIDSLEKMYSPLTCADIALQYAKKKQGDAIQVFNNALLNNFKEGSQIERDLQSALKNREFELYYQPLKDLQSQQYVAAEALIRWHHPKKGVLYPGAFIDIAEQSGLINAIGEWVLEAACKQLHLWQRHKIEIAMHVNVAAQQFFSTNLYDQVWQFMTRYQIKPQTLILEITETELMEDIVYATKLCKELAELGVGLAIDDFGTGYSSMRYLKQFPISKLKIDRSFISDLGISHESREIVSAIIAMAKALNISLTAEGVETEEQEQFLTQLHCHHAQGFLYSPALREAEFSLFIKTNASLPQLNSSLNSTA
ncbi:EAL domain-containing protein [Shewanella sp. Isolate11]|uniref:putative bifunctional diguanylate cyclase/phosphodiesterase n=1 Tax=Shewanella sp. Isolate11 TaxID=2908530 RepID=UPI001EFE9DAA|nr:EAL domain-containing protein [Shewanella sp. Isolate11]MCG9696592.1 EAL domain-containing protein [Shewanella sp. Isolate11]